MNIVIRIIGVGLLVMGLLLGVFVFSNAKEGQFDFGTHAEEIKVEEAIVTEEEVVVELLVDRPLAEDAEPLRLKSVGNLLKTLREAETDTNGKVILNSEIRYQFNGFCDLYWMRFMPNVDNYEFEYQGAAAWYMFFIWDSEFGRFPDSISSQEMELSLQELFKNKVDGYLPFEHKPYRKYVRYEDGYYSLVPQSYNNSIGIYNPLEISIREDGEGYLVTAQMQEYFFDNNSIYEPGEQEIILMEKADQLGLSFNTTIMELLERDQMDDFEPRRKMMLKMYIDSNEIPHIIQFYNGEETYRLD
jgi:hypothetical protein